jgi:DNA-binding response OmpR family regulator
VQLQKPSGRPHSNRPSQLVLIVDDDEDIRSSLHRTLVEWGYRVVCAEDGDDAMAIVQRVTPATIILDLCMPRVSGYAFREWQLAQPTLSRVPVIVLTAAGSNATDDLPGVASLYKPIDVDLLQALLVVQIAS